MQPITALMVSRALADEHRRTAERRRRDKRQHREPNTAAPRSPLAWPFRLPRSRPSGSGA